MDKTEILNSINDGDPRIPLTTIGELMVEQVPSSSLIWLKINIPDEKYIEMLLDDEAADENEETDYSKLMATINSLVVSYYPELSDVSIHWNDTGDPSRNFDGQHDFLMSDFDFGEDNA